MSPGNHLTRIARRAARRIAHGSPLVLLLVPHISGHAQSPTSVPPAEWPTYGGDYTNQRYSALSGINRDNVARLVPRRVLQTGTERVNGLLASPIVHDGVMYMTTPYNQAIAWDLRSGATRWRYEHKLGPYIPCCGPTNRGAASGHGLIFMATLDARLVALEAATGAVRWEVEESAPDSAYSFTLAPLVVADLVIVGTSGAEYATRGRVTAYDARTGKRRWRWFAIPSPEEGGWWGRWSPTTPAGDVLPRDIARERADSARYADAWRIGGGSVWTTPAYDPESGLLYLGIGNPVPEYQATVRPGDNLYTVSVVALEARTGKLRWYHQYIPHDIWDYDAANPPVLFSREDRTLVAHASKPGWVHVLDAKTGEQVLRSEPFVPQHNLFVPPPPEGHWRAPGAAGGADWHPSAYSPATGLLYVPAVHYPMFVKSFPQEAEKGRDYRGGNEEQLAGPDSTWSSLAAVDLANGRIRWERRIAPRAPLGGALATAGGLVFAGDLSGWFRAYDAETSDAVGVLLRGRRQRAPDHIHPERRAVRRGCGRRELLRGPLGRRGAPVRAAEGVWGRREWAVTLRVAYLLRLPGSRFRLSVTPSLPRPAVTAGPRTPQCWPPRARRRHRRPASLSATTTRSCSPSRASYV